MLEPPSAPLLTLLRELRLCSPADLRRCRGRVRRLATDLPAFDSVWIDALVQLRRLTPFQAQVLESPNPRRLRVGPCVLVERLGTSNTGVTYLGRSIATRQLRNLKLIEVEEDLVTEILKRSRDLMEAGRKADHPSIVIPQACEQFDDRLVFVSRHVPGRTLTELLVRRGRFPAHVVWQIARQLADGLVRLHAAGLAHGDIRPSQVRLLSEGTAVLVDTGIQGVVEPELTPHSQLEPESYDCVAPELIGTGITYNPASDLYALGCLLWQLLAGRPPFPGGDPLAKLASHQTRRIRDVRDFAPDTPDKLAEMIIKLTSPNIGERPANAAMVLQSLGPPRRSGRRFLKRFVASFERPAATDGRSAGRSRVALVVLLLLAATGLAAAGRHDGTRASLLRMWASIPETQTGTTPESSTTPAEQSANAAAAIPPAATAQRPVGTLQTLPEPDAQGVISLNSPGPYAVRSITQIGALTIRGRADFPAEIVFENEPLFLLAEKVQLQHITFRRATAQADDEQPAETLDAQVLVQALELEVRDCAFVTHAPMQEALPNVDAGPRQYSRPAAICWKVPEAAGGRNGTATLENVVVWGRSPLLDLRSPARQIIGRNVLRLGAGPFLHIAAPPTSSLELGLELEHVTCRNSGSLIRWTGLEQKPARHHVVVRARDCVFDIQPAEGGLLEFVGEKFIADWSRRVKFVGMACLASEQTEVAVQRLPGADTAAALDGELELEGITQEAFAFTGAFGPVPALSSILEPDVGVRGGGGVPGIIAGKLKSPVGDASATDAATSEGATGDGFLPPRLSAAVPVTSRGRPSR